MIPDRYLLGIMGKNKDRTLKNTMPIGAKTSVFKKPTRIMLCKAFSGYTREIKGDLYDVAVAQSGERQLIVQLALQT
jgi:hypothetical protein